MIHYASQYPHLCWCHISLKSINRRTQKLIAQSQHSQVPILISVLLNLTVLTQYASISALYSSLSSWIDWARPASKKVWKHLTLQERWSYWKVKRFLVGIDNFLTKLMTSNFFANGFNLNNHSLPSTSHKVKTEWLQDFFHHEEANLDGHTCRIRLPEYAGQNFLESREK